MKRSRAYRVRWWLVAMAVSVVLWLMGFAALWAAGVFSDCHTRACTKRVAAKHRWNRCAYRHGARYCTFRNRWLRLPEGARYWTRCVSSKESGNRRVARESGHWSYFQWTLGTFHAAGGQGNPEDVDWHEQAVRAWHWHVRVPSGQWPNTGERGLCGS